MARGSVRKSVTATRAPAPTRRRPSAAHSNSHLLERLLFMSDAVFAIVMTLLALELRVPEGFSDATVMEALREMTPKLIAFAISFAVISVFWIGHATITRDLKQFDWAVGWANLVFLFTLTLIPLATALLGEFGQMGNAWRLYCLALIAIGISQMVLVAVINRGGGKLIGSRTRRQLLYRLGRAAAPGLGFAVALTVSLMGYPLISQFSWVSIPLFMAAAGWLWGPKKDEAA